MPSKRKKSESEYSTSANTVRERKRRAKLDSTDPKEAFRQKKKRANDGVIGYAKKKARERQEFKDAVTIGNMDEQKRLLDIAHNSAVTKL
jgi:hypothetical protein